MTPAENECNEVRGVGGIDPESRNVGRRIQVRFCVFMAKENNSSLVISEWFLYNPTDASPPSTSCKPSLHHA